MGALRSVEEMKALIHGVVDGGSKKSLLIGAVASTCFCQLNWTVRSQEAVALRVCGFAAQAGLAVVQAQLWNGPECTGALQSLTGLGLVGAFQGIVFLLTNSN